MTDALVRVALPLPLSVDYTYRVPEPLDGVVAVGMRAVVPVRDRELIGIVTALGAEAPARPARDVLALPDPSPLLSSSLLELATWMAAYYGAPRGLALRAMLPAGMWGASQVRLRVADHARGDGPTADALVAWLRERGGSGSAAAARRALHRDIWDVVRRLAARGELALEVEAPDTSA
ncbi:MAG: hypothetical protein MUC69_07795, partial [Gemmatimonadales bacterium]|nr:hypothetical protein [Gemmatimonadales bacterium]